MTFGVTSDGFIKKTLSDIIESHQEKAKEIFGINVDLTASSPIEMFLEICAIEEATIWDVLEDLYYTGYVDTADGANLDAIATLVGISRTPAAYASGVVRFTGISGTVIPQLTRVQTPDAVIFRTMIVGIIPSGSVRDIGVGAVEYGEGGNVASESITDFVQPVAGIISLYNPSETAGGGDVETDADFRDRIKNALARASVATLSGIVANVEAVDGVLSVSATENLIAHTAALVVDGGVDLDITNKIAEVRPAGIEVTWSRPSDVSIYVTAIIVQDGSVTSSSIIETISNFINASDVGEDVSFAKLLHAIMNMDGIEDVDLSIGTSSPPTGKSNISITGNQTAYTQTSYISIS
jgi:uncharacterized phage protein gp47/JayE